MSNKFILHQIAFACNIAEVCIAIVTGLNHNTACWNFLDNPAVNLPIHHTCVSFIHCLARVSI
jgi:hypothetical protein